MLLSQSFVIDSFKTLTSFVGTEYLFRNILGNMEDKAKLQEKIAAKKKKAEEEAAAAHQSATKTVVSKKKTAKKSDSVDDLLNAGLSSTKKGEKK